MIITADQACLGFDYVQLTLNIYVNNNSLFVFHHAFQIWSIVSANPGLRNSHDSPEFQHLHISLRLRKKSQNITAKNYDYYPILWIVTCKNCHLWIHTKTDIEEPRTWKDDQDVVALYSNESRSRWLDNNLTYRIR